MIVDVDDIENHQEYFNRWVGKTVTKIEAQEADCRIKIYFDDGTNFEIDATEDYGTPFLSVTIEFP